MASPVSTLTPQLAEEIMTRLRNDPHVKLQDRGNGHYYGNSPLRSGDSKNWRLSRTSDGLLVWYDQKTHDRGGVIALAEHYGIEIPKGGAEREGTKIVYRDLKDYAEKHGVDVSVFHAAKWRDNTISGRPCITFPTLNGERHRFLDAGEKRFLNPTGYERCFFGLDAAIRAADEQKKPVVLVNGEATVVVCHHFGIPAFCQTSGEQPLAPHLLTTLETLWSGDIIIALDCDEHGRRTADLIASQLRKNRHAILDLGLNDGADVADFLKLYNTKTGGPGRSVDAFWDLPIEWRVAEKEDTYKVDLITLARVTQELNRTMQLNASIEKAQKVENLLAENDAIVDRIRQQRTRPKVLSGPEAAKLLREDMARRRHAAETGELYGISTGLPSLDEAIGGLQRKAVAVFMGASGMGKSTVISTIAANMIEAGLRILLVPTELSAEEAQYKIISAMTGIPASRMIKKWRLNREENLAADAALSIIEQHIEILAMFKPSPKDLEATLRSAYQDKPYDVCLVDSLTHLAPPTDASASADAYDILLGAAKELNVAIAATLQADFKKIEGRREGEHLPRLSDAYGSQRSVMDAAVFYGIFNFWYYSKRGLEPSESPVDKFNRELYPKGTITLLNLKERYGDEGGNSILFGFPDGCRIEDLTDTRF